MSLSFQSTERWVLFAAGVPVTYLVAVAIGRWLKRKAGVHLGFAYQFFCVALSIYIPSLLLPKAPTLGPFDEWRDLGAIVALLGTVFLLALVRRYVWEIYFGQRRQTEIPRFLQELLAFVAFIVAVILVLTLDYKQNIPGLVAGSGIVAVVLGFAMQDLLGNMMSGISIQIGKPFKPGDWLIVESGQHAEVMEVNWRSTRLRTNDHIYLDIPNNQIVRHTIINVAYPTNLHAMRIRIGVDYTVPPNTVKDAIIQAALSAHGVNATPRPKAYLVDFADSAVIYEIKFWMENHALLNEINDSIRTDIWYEFRRRKIKIPYPMRTLRIEPRQTAAQSHGIVAETRTSLRRQPFFQCLDDAQTDLLLSSANLLRFGREEDIISQGADGNSMFILVDGTAKVHIDRNGHSVQVGSLKTGDCFGEMSLLTGEKRSATVEAVTDCDVLEIGKSVFGDILRQTPALAEKLSELLAHRRMENEGILASTAEKNTIVAKQEEYAASFFARLSSFFEL